MEPVDVKKHSNPNATIGFVIFYPFQYYVYKNIYKQLEAESEFIIDQRLPLAPDVRRTLLNEIETLLKKERVPYRIVNEEDYYSQAYLKKFFAGYKALVSVWERGCMVHSATAHIKKICSTYGAGKELTMVRPSRGIYDLILSYGPRDTALLSYYTHAEMVGNPKFDDWFNNTIDQDAVSAMRKRLDPKKKTVLYLPTHSDLSSIDIIAPELAALRDEYNMIVKVHYYTTREEPSRMDVLHKTGVILETDGTDLLPLLRVADVVISDNSSAIFDVILADKPVVVADFWDKEYLDRTHKEIRRYDVRSQGALTYSDSIEQVIKRDGSVVAIKKAEDLRKEIATALDDQEFYKKRRRELRKELFVHADGTASEHAARAIRECIAETIPRSRPILYHGIEAYKRHVGILSYEREKYLNAELARYKSVLDEKVLDDGRVFSVLYMRESGVNADVERAAIRSILEQDIPPDSYEIILCRMPQKEFDEIVHSIPQLSGRMPAVRELSKTHSSLGAQFNEAIAMARGTYICFASNSCTMPSNWLDTLYLTYKKEPATAGVGGYVYTKQELISLFDEYRYYDIARQLNISVRDQFWFRFLFEVTDQLFDQNPAGDLRAMSYRKDSVAPAAPDSDDLTYLGLYFKLTVISEHPLTFIPRTITSLQKMERARFLKSARMKGFFDRMYRADIERVWLYEPVNLAGAIWRALCSAVRLRSLVSFFVFFEGGYMQWLGRIQAVSRLSSLTMRAEK